MKNMERLPKLPSLLERKIYKTGQTRGADDDEIYQNRVGRNSTILIPFSQFEKYYNEKIYSLKYENGFIVFISPKDFFNPDSKGIIRKYKLNLGDNLLIFYETREDWNKYNPEKMGFMVAKSRTTPLQGEYVARIPATTAEKGEKIIKGFNLTKLKGAGIRAYEYASSQIINDAKLQLEAIFWHCYDADSIVMKYGMSKNDVIKRKKWALSESAKRGLLDYKKLIDERILNAEHIAICPLCLEKISANGFFNKVSQAEGREVIDLTITQLNLFHIHELRYGEFNHMPYNLGWGHHFCNVVVKDAGINNTLEWMINVLRRNSFTVD
jgi:hypothetical protein